MSVHKLARRFKLDVSTDNSTWIPFKGITDLQVKENATVVDVTDYDTDGFTAKEKTLSGATITVKADGPLNAGVADPGQEIVRATQYQFGSAARVYIRWYDRNNLPEAYSCYALANWSASKTGVGDAEEITAVFDSDGAITSITNPVTMANVPAITSVTPSGVAAGGIIRIQGAYFTTPVATTGVKIGGVNATSWDYISDSLIEAVMPAGSAGSAPVIVTTSAGASAAFPYTRA